jgi:uncharacterized Zn finger protein
MKHMDDWINRTENCVEPDQACPECGEDYIDSLIWLDDEKVECQSCGKVYFPRPE